MAVSEGQLVEITVKRSCEFCEHAAFSSSGVYCTLFNDDIWRPEETAVECGEYDPVPWAPDEGAEGEGSCSSTASP